MTPGGPDGQTAGARPAPACSTPSERRRVVIAGGGYAGTTCAVALGRALRRGGGDGIEVLLIEPHPCQQALSELDLVAVGPPKPLFCELWHPVVFKHLPVTLCYDRLSDVRTGDHVAIVGDGREVPYWRLVIATGAIPSIPPIPGLADHAITMWSVDDAQRLQQAVEDALKEAARSPRPEQRRRVLSVTVVGGGATGVEIVGTIAQMLPRRLREAGLDPDEFSIHLIEGRPEILYDLRPRQRELAVRRLERMGVRVITGSLLSKVAEGVAHLADGTEVPSSVLVWCGGAKADPHAADWGIELDPVGRLVVDRALKASGCEDVYVIGDVASPRDPDTGRSLPMLAQMAIQEGPHTAKNLLRESAGLPPEPFVPHMRGEFVSVGPRWGVGWMYGVGLTGLPAITMKRITYVKYWLQVGGLPLAWKRTWEMLRMSS